MFTLVRARLGSGSFSIVVGYSLIKQVALSQLRCFEGVMLMLTILSVANLLIDGLFSPRRLLK